MELKALLNNKEYLLFAERNAKGEIITKLADMEGNIYNFNELIEASRSKKKLHRKEEKEILLVETFETTIIQTQDKTYTRMFYNLYDPYDILHINIAEYPTAKEQQRLIAKVKREHKYKTIIYR